MHASVFRLTVIRGGMDNTARKSAPGPGTLLPEEQEPSRHELSYQLKAADVRLASYRFINGLLLAIVGLLIVICVGLGTVISSLVS